MPIAAIDIQDVAAFYIASAAWFRSHVGFIGIHACDIPKIPQYDS